MREQIHLPDFSASTEPPWNNPQSLPSAFEAVMLAGNEESSQTAYHRLLSAIGNDHAGTYYPVALEILPATEAILRDGSAWARRIALEVLIDLFGSFEPEPGFEVHRGVELERAVRSGIVGFAPCLGELASGDEVDARGARELLASIRDRTEESRNEST